MATVNGTNGDDARVLGTTGDDTINGLGGNDLLEGGQGRDTYVFDADFGNDIIADDDGSGGNNPGDRIVFRADKLSDVKSVRKTGSGDGANLVITTKNGTVNIRDFERLRDRVEVFEFMDQTVVWNGSKLVGLDEFLVDTIRRQTSIPTKALNTNTLLTQIQNSGHLSGNEKENISDFVKEYNSASPSQKYDIIESVSDQSPNASVYDNVTKKYIEAVDKIDKINKALAENTKKDPFGAIFEKFSHVVGNTLVIDGIFGAKAAQVVKDAERNLGRSLTSEEDAFLNGIFGRPEFAKNPELAGRIARDFEKYRKEYEIEMAAKLAKRGDGYTDDNHPFRSEIYGDGPVGCNGCPPIVLDLDRDGALDLVSNDRGGWVGPSDGFLAVDRNGSGAIDDLSEIAFVEEDQRARTDLEGLAYGFDSNGDGVVNNQDERFAELQVFQDTNGDGVSESGELMNLEEAGITSIDVSGVPYKGEPSAIQERAGNRVFGVTTVAHDDGSFSIAGDVALGHDHMSVAEGPEAGAATEQLATHVASMTSAVDKLTSAIAAMPTQEGYSWRRNNQIDHPTPTLLAA